ncbi:uncharacterized protein [Prorops nasuta]|uniref:uncharacterized protein isoform X2 n=1 Tax=Prorops nasuta TaxID=863751 RepID=UPI0034CE2D28
MILKFISRMSEPRWTWLVILTLLYESVLSSFVAMENVHRQCRPCYRRVLSGKKITENHVRRAIECERISDCNRACDYEKYFVCEGFNYRRTGPGTRGTCELTSTAYPRIDMQRDFAIDSQCDYYERDENCQKAEPNERPQWWSYGTPSRPANEYPRSFNYDRRPVDYDQASGYPPPYRRPNPVNRRPVDPYPDRYQPDRSYDRPYHPRYPDNNYYYRDRDRPYPKYPERRIDQRPYPDIGSNEIGPFLPENRPDFNRDWRYGGSFGYNTNNIGSYDASKIPVKRPQRPEKRPLDNDRFYGEFYNYGGAFGYGDTYPPTSRDQIYGGNGKGQECSIRTAAGFKIGRGIVGKTFLTPNVDHCENLCANEKAFVCLTFAYRYNVESSDPTDNCLLSRVSYRDLNFYTDLEPDRNYDIYVMVGDIKTCSAKKPSNLPPPDECFWRVRSGFGMPPEVTKKTMTVDGIGNCQAQCTATQNFTCRSFAFRYESQNRPRNGDGSNCYLSDWPSQEINPVNMPDMDGAELYERGSYGRGCEPYPFSLMSPGRLADNSPPTQRDEGCYSGYHRPCKLTPYAVLLSMRAESEADCRQKCSRMRERDSVPCMSFSYKISGTGRDDNCMLSDVPIRDLRPGLDYTYDDNHVLYAYKELDPNCVIPGYGMDDDHVYGPNSGPNSGPGKPLYAGYSNVEGRPGYFGAVRPFVQGPRPQDQNYQGIRPVEPNRPNGGPYGQVPATISSSGLPGPMAPNRPGVSGGYGGSNGNGYPGYGSSNLNTDESTLNQYTVNGYPCKRNTRCERNKIAGFYSCETEGSEFGSWDYCCQPSHQCGYSEGFNYPWCYVGHSVDQWRPCSEKYYPYSPNSRPQRPPIGDPYGSNGDRGVYDPYTGRYWPIIYLHREPPPNSTDSVPSAADSTSTTEMRSINLTTTTLLPTEQTPDNQTEEQSSRLRKARRLRTRTVPDENNIATPDDYNTSKGNPILSRRTNARFNAFRSKTKDRAAKVERTFRSTVGQVKNGAKNANLLTMSTTAPSTNLFLTTQDFTNNSPKFSTDISDDDYIKSTDSKLFETPLILSNATSLI